LWPSGRGLNFKIEVDNVDHFCKKVENHGIKLFRSFRETWYNISDGKKDGQREFLAEDPDGYFLRFSQILI
jgi:hypothetical protein